VDSTLQQHYGGIPYLISGPPGTGKTKTIVEIALQLIHRPDEVRTHILLCAPSDPAADILARRIKEHVPYQDLFRLNSPTRSFAEVPGALLPYCHTTNDFFSLPAFPQLMSYRIIVTTCRDASILVEARVTNRDLAKLERGIVNAIHFGGKQNNLKTSLHWNALLLDEAAQATEPEAGIPLSVVAPPDKGIIGGVQVVMAGDQYQLGPRLSSRGGALEMSLFERLFNRSIYRDHPRSRRLLKRSNSTGINEPNEPIIRPPFANLFQNYRSHPAILAIPSALFYNDTLISRATNNDCMSEWVGWRGRRWPVLFACNVGGDVRPLEGFGWSNRPEAKKACDFAKSLVDDGHLEERDICIMSPFRAQVKLLRDIIRSEPYKLRDVNVGPTEAFQGLESRFVIICTTRTESRHLDEDWAEGLGIINQAKRFNVAMTRAKQGLIVIGNPWVLSKDNSWNTFIKFCLRHRLWEEDSEDSQSVSSSMREEASDTVTSQHISSLERGLIYAEEHADKLPVRNKRSLITQEEDAMWVGGHAAEEALYTSIDENAQDGSDVPSMIQWMESY
jgi:helicase MOV-10